MNKIAKDFPTLKSKGTKDIFINVSKESNRLKIQNFINMAKKFKLRVHISLYSFLDEKEKGNSGEMGIEKIKNFVTFKNLAGIHLDYLEYVKETYKYKGINAINSFIRQTINQIKKINKDLIVSTSFILEKSKIKEYFEQDFKHISKYFDVIIPFIKKEEEESIQTLISKSSFSRIWIGFLNYQDNNYNQQDEYTSTRYIRNYDGLIIFKNELNDYINFHQIENEKNPDKPLNEYIEDPIYVEKPVIYLYPLRPMNISVKLNFKKTKFTTIYPKFNEENTWKVYAKPNGDIIMNNKTYPYLFWETESSNYQNMNKGFIVKAEEAQNFLEEKLKILGLNNKESSEFIVYWLPTLIKNKLSLCSFQTQEFFNNFELDINPKPNSILRVFLSIKKIDYPFNIQEQKLKSFERKGFTVVEWGGSKITNK